MLANVQNSEVPPEEISGNGIPLVGTSESTTLILKKAWSRMAVVSPKAVNRANGSWERKAARNPRTPNTTNSVTTHMEPMKPSSSAMFAKIKSVYASGR